MKNVLNDQQYDIEKHAEQLKDKIKAMSKLKGQEKHANAEILRTQLRKLTNQIKSYQLSIISVEMEQAQKSLKSKQLIDTAKMKENLKKYQKKAETLKQNLQYAKNERVRTQDLFQGRQERVQVNGMNERDRMIADMERVQDEDLGTAKRVLKMGYQMQGIADGINQELQKQIQQLDSIYNQLQQTSSTMKRAQQQINQFARNVYTDKLLMGLIVLIVIAIVVIIILSALGKTPSDLVPDTIK